MKDAYEEVLAPVVRALLPHLDQLVVIGGWVPELHRRFGSDGDWAVKPLRTIEVDVLVAGEEVDSLDASLEDAGFRPVGDTPSAVWERDLGRGERIEFFVDHEGAWNEMATIAALDSETAGAMRLADLRVLRDKCTTLSIPLEEEGAGTSVAALRVPELGAFLVQKGAVFRRRPDTARRVKDIHYIVDVMQSGEGVVTRVEAEIAAYCAEGGAAAELARKARNLVGLLVKEDGSSELRSGLSSALAERHAWTPTEADTRAEGYLRDFLGLIPEGCGGL